MTGTLTTPEVQERISYEAFPCPECGQAMVGARVFDPRAQEAFVGAVCVPCDGAYRVVWTETSDKDQQGRRMPRTHDAGPA